MRDINYELRSSYFSLLAGNIFINSAPVSIYYAQVPLTNPPLNPDNYILINTVFSSNFNDDRFNYTQTSIQFMIVTKALQNNSGYNADNIAGQIFNIIYPSPQAQIVQIVSGQVINTQLQNDVMQSGLNDGLKKVVNRIITFTHKIQHYLGVTSGNIYYGVQSNGNNPTDFSLSLQQNANIPISINYGAQSSPKFFWMAAPANSITKTDWEDLNDEGNAGKIGGSTDLFAVSTIVHASVSYTLYMCRYATNFNGYASVVRYS